MAVVRPDPRPHEKIRKLQARREREESARASQEGEERATSTPLATLFGAERAHRKRPALWRVGGGWVVKSGRRWAVGGGWAVVGDLE